MHRLYFIMFFLWVFLTLWMLDDVGARKREKRFLHFPPKTNVVITMSLLKLLPTESIVNTLTELDALFPLPLHPFEDGLHPRKKRELERNVIFSKLKEIGNYFGLEGDSCLRKFICELNNSIPPTTEYEDNVLRDIVDIIFTPNVSVPEGCHKMNDGCYFI